MEESPKNEDPGQQEGGEVNPEGRPKSETSVMCVVSHSNGTKSDRQDIHRPVTVRDLTIFDSQSQQSLRNVPQILPPLTPDRDCRVVPLA
jgi:hypothetical protein